MNSINASIAVYSVCVWMCVDVFVWSTAAQEEGGEAADRVWGGDNQASVVPVPLALPPCSRITLQ